MMVLCWSTCAGIQGGQSFGYMTHPTNCAVNTFICELPITLFRPFEPQIFESFAVTVLLPIVNENIVPGEVVTFGSVVCNLVI